MLLHRWWHCGFSVCRLCSLSDSFSSFQLVLFLLLSEYQDRASSRNWVGSEGRSIEACVLICNNIRCLLGNSLLLCLPELEWCLSLPCDGDRLGPDSLPSSQVSLLDVRVSWNQHLWRNRFASELALDQCILLKSPFLYHCFNLALPDGLAFSFVSHVETKGFWHGHAIFAFRCLGGCRSGRIILLGQFGLCKILGGFRRSGCLLTSTVLMIVFIVGFTMEIAVFFNELLTFVTDNHGIFSSGLLFNFMATVWAEILNIYCLLTSI